MEWDLPQKKGAKIADMSIPGEPSGDAVDNNAKISSMISNVGIENRGKLTRSGDSSHPIHCYIYKWSNSTNRVQTCTDLHKLTCISHALLSSPQIEQSMTL